MKGIRNSAEDPAVPETTIIWDPIVTDRLTRLRYDHLTGRIGGITAVCSAHRTILEAAIEQAAVDGDVLLVEATANQVNQFGGYTGMRPAEFVTFVQSLAAEADFPLEKVIIGGDHLGPHPWKKAPATTPPVRSRYQAKTSPGKKVAKCHHCTVTRLCPKAKKRQAMTAPQPMGTPKMSQRR